jgi:RNA polymerase sigma-70 factor, ECF subfamily
MRAVSAWWLLRMFQNRNLGNAVNNGLPTCNMKLGQMPEGTDPPLDARDGEVRGLVLRNEVRAAANLLVSIYGPELQVFLHRVLGEVALVDEAFSSTCERLWRGLPGFRWESSLRSWCYVIARREASRCRTRARARNNETTLSAAEGVPAAATQSTVSTTRRAQLDSLRAALSDEDRDLLVLRVEQDLSWKEIASAFLDEDSDPALIERESARLRQRFRAIRVTVAAAMSSNNPGGPTKP